MIIAGVAACFVGFFVVEHVCYARRTTVELAERRARWREKYGLTEQQTLEVQRIEKAYHGTGDPIFSRIHDFRENRIHFTGTAFSDEDNRSQTIGRVLIR